MKLKLIRVRPTQKSTIGQLYIDDVNTCHTLEDVDRGLYQNMPLEKIKAIKVHGQTAIPKGTYDVIITMSVRFKRELPLLLNVPGFEGIRMHPGNKPEDTEGCLLVGRTVGNDFIGESRIAFDNIFKQMKAAIAKNQRITITIE